MEQQKRGWVKNVAIILLAVLLVLTFFSNTIMNHSLPEVAAERIQSGSVTARIRGSGIVESNQNYDVTVSQSRKVESVMITQGKEVSVGDILFVLSSAGSEELEAAEEELRQLEKSYQTALINSSVSDYAKENLEIQRAREDLLAAQEERSQLSVTYVDTAPYERKIAEASVDLEEAGTALTAANNRCEAAESSLSAAQESYDSISQKAVSAETLLTLKSTAEQQAAELETAQNTLETKWLQYGGAYSWIEAEAAAEIRSTADYASLADPVSQENFVQDKLPVYMPYVVSRIMEGELLPYGGEFDPEAAAKYETAYSEIQSAQTYAETCQWTWEQAQAEYNAALNSEFTSEDLYQAELVLQQAQEEERAASLQLSSAQQTHEDAQTALSDAESALEEVVTKMTDEIDAIKAADEKVQSAERVLQDQVYSLQALQNSDNRQARLDALETQELQEKLTAKEEEVSKLREGADISQVTAPVSGIIESVNITAGATTVPGESMASIEIPDMGYSVSFSVSNDQAKRVHVGDVASVSNIYWGIEVDAELVSIKSDPKDPQNSKVLTFNVSGDITPGITLTLSVGERSAEYDAVVPNSSLRSDSNGDFILVLQAKSSPLGDRYTAARVDITKLASDDSVTAVSGAVNTGDYVITTSTSPIENGSRVRLADTQTGG